MIQHVCQGNEDSVVDAVKYTSKISATHSTEYENATCQSSGAHGGIVRRGSDRTADSGRTFAGSHGTPPLHADGRMNTIHEDG